MDDETMDTNQNQAQKLVLHRIRNICESFRIDSLRPKITAIEDAFQETDRINVALLGGFKAGKSSFVNSIIGKDILPVGVVPLTSVITYVKYGSEERAEVRFTSGKMKLINFNELVDYITEDCNPKNIKEAIRVDIELPGLQAYKKIQFVDTPGFGSAYQHNTLTATDWLPKVGAAFFVVSSAHPLSERDILLLKELERHTSEIIILLAKVDLVSDKEAGQITDFIHRQLKQHLQKEFRILAFSNRPGFESMREVVFGFIQHSFSNPVQKSQEILNHKIRSSITECQEYLRIALLMAQSEQASREKLSELLSRERQSLAAIDREIALITSDLKRKFQEKALDEFLEYYQGVKRELAADLKTQLPQWKGNLVKISERFRRWAGTTLILKMKTISDERGSKISQVYLNEGMISLTRIVHAFQGRLKDVIEQALHTKFTGIEFHIEAEKPKQPDIDIGHVFMFSWEVIWYLIPMTIFRPIVNRHFFSLIPREVEKNLYRVRAQWCESVFYSIDKMAKDASLFIHNEAETIQNILANAPNQQVRIGKAISELEEARVSS